MRVELIDAAQKEFPIQRLCKVLGVSPSGYFTWKDRPAFRRQRTDMAMLPTAARPLPFPTRHMAAHA